MIGQIEEYRSERAGRKQAREWDFEYELWDFESGLKRYKLSILQNQIQTTPYSTILGKNASTERSVLVFL